MLGSRRPLADTQAPNFDLRGIYIVAAEQQSNSNDPSLLNQPQQIRLVFVFWRISL
ncbi:protein of unknown function [Methylotuvimicrobium alcaliphilum 20Z]|uniref:Uncharacterized protein n=1 Tax=Methylotuvimicrobium alcaliphilum (strain DSM 19304 / NCIMB 14124 / VKM B-2133 / 20Z) TaxID=1091494 RepID=G4SYC4_META2|nr:protein of unknown function [Methylotuvimicrobium alcaliphilum 20Z]